jgi:hypothetical protein
MCCAIPEPVFLCSGMDDLFGIYRRSEAVMIWCEVNAIAKVGVIVVGNC